MFMRRKEKKFWWTQRSDYNTELHLQTSHICSAESGEQRTVYISPRALVVTVFIYKLLILFEETFLRTILSQRWEDRTINNKLPRQDNVLF